MTTLLEQQMKKYHEYIKPRYSNLTYASTNIGSTLGMHTPMIVRSLKNSLSYSEIKPSSRQQLGHMPESPIYKRSISQLSKAGINSIRPLDNYSSVKQVYQKQQKYYNIINMLPKQYEDTIKIYPKYHLENEDGNYYRKMQLERELSQKMNQKREARSMRNSQDYHNERIKYMHNMPEMM